MRRRRRCVHAKAGLPYRAPPRAVRSVVRPWRVRLSQARRASCRAIGDRVLRVHEVCSRAGVRRSVKGRRPPWIPARTRRGHRRPGRGARARWCSAPRSCWSASRAPLPPSTRGGVDRRSLCAQLPRTGCACRMRALRGCTRRASARTVPSVDDVNLRSLRGRVGDVRQARRGDRPRDCARKRPSLSNPSVQAGVAAAAPRRPPMTDARVLSKI